MRISKEIKEIEEIIERIVLREMRRVCEHYKIEYEEAKKVILEGEEESEIERQIIRGKVMERVIETVTEKEGESGKRMEAEKENQSERQKEAQKETEKEDQTEMQMEVQKEDQSEREKKKERKSEVKKKRKKEIERRKEIEIELPFSGEIYEERCKGIRVAGKLYTQCLVYVNEGKRYCQKCEKESLKNASGKPNNGDIQERAEVGIYEYKDKDGKNPWAYYKIMRKHGWSKEYVEEIGEKHGIKISSEHYNEEEMSKKVHQKGRKKGRPKKEKKEIEIEEEEEVKEEEVIKKELEIEETIEEIEIEEIVEEIEYNGEKYLRSKSSGLIYSSEELENPKIVGIWDTINDDIDFNYVHDEALTDDEE